MCGMCGLVKELPSNSKWTHLDNDRLLLESLPGWLGLGRWLTLTGIICPECRDAYLVAEEYGQ